MSLDTLLMLIGVSLALLPFLGFPLQWDNIILVALGILTITLGVIVRRRGLVRRPTSPSSFVDSHQSDSHAL